MKIGILTCALPPAPVVAAHGPFQTMFETLFADQGFTFQNWNVEQMEFPAAPSDADAWLITGARHGVYEDHAFIPPLEDFVRQLMAVKAPTVAICFGHQIVARALGARVEKFEGGWAIGRKSYQMEGLGQIHLNAWHQDQVLELPEGARVIASNPFTEFAGLRYGDHCMTLQPHPEIRPDVMKTYADWQLGQGKHDEAFLRGVIADTDKPGDERAIGQIFGDFLRAAHMARTVPV